MLSRLVAWLRRNRPETTDAAEAAADGARRASVQAPSARELAAEAARVAQASASREFAARTGEAPPATASAATSDRPDLAPEPAPSAPVVAPEPPVAQAPVEQGLESLDTKAEPPAAPEPPAKRERPVLKPKPLMGDGPDLGAVPQPKPRDLPLAAGDGATTIPVSTARKPEPLGLAPGVQRPGRAAPPAQPETPRQDAPPAPAAPSSPAIKADRPELALTTPATIAEAKTAPVSERSLQNPEERETRMTDAQSVLAMIKEKEVEYVDLRFTDPRGKMQHVTMDVDSADEDMFSDGVMFDGSSIAGWKAINESDMVLMPDTSTAVMDPFYAQNTLAVLCDILEPSGEPYSRDPRSTSKKAVEYLKSTGIGDTVYVGPEAEFFVFDSVRFEVAPNRVAYEVDSADMMDNSWTEYEMGNMGHRPRVKGGYFPVNPIDSGQDMRSEMLSTMKKMGVPVEKHHHEVASAQHELGFKFSPLTIGGDYLQLYKYCIHNVAAAYGKSATFMPKPVKGDNGTGMHVHQSIWKDGQPLFAGNQYADLSEECLYYIGGILKHAKALNAFTNPSTNSYKRLIPGFEAPVLLAYSARNRSASCRIPHATSPKGKRVETRFPDPTANPYLAFTALMMAGLDGIQNKIHPGEPMDKDLYALPPEELKNIPTVCGSLREALESLDADHEFLMKGDVFTKDQLEAYAELKMEEVYEYEHTPHPVEFDMYYSV